VAMMRGAFEQIQLKPLIWRKQRRARTLAQRVRINHTDYLFTLSGTKASALLVIISEPANYKGRPRDNNKLARVQTRRQKLNYTHQGEEQFSSLNSSRRIKSAAAFSPRLSRRTFTAAAHTLWAGESSLFLIIILIYVHTRDEKPTGTLFDQHTNMLLIFQLLSEKSRFRLLPNFCLSSNCML
jgi:hypothetical protein